jgi:ABC-2 type transport system ATP-binding protein
LSIEAGTVYGLTGRNGAGKTTAIRLLLGLLKPDSGKARLLGQDWWTASHQDRQRVAYVSQTSPHPEWMTLQNLCQYAERFYSRWNNGLALKLAKRWELPWNRPLGHLSGGNQRLASLLVALSTQPEVLLLDEPASGLDPVARRDLLGCLAESLSHDAQMTVLLSTHLLSDLERLATHVGILDHGRLLTEGSVEDWTRTMRRVQVVFPGETVPVGFEIPGSLRYQTLGPVYSAVVRIVDETQLRITGRWPGARMQVFPLSLEELFLALYRKTLLGEDESEDEIDTFDQTQFEVVQADPGLDHPGSRPNEP